MLKAEDVKRAAEGRWPEIHNVLAPSLRPALARAIGRHVPCPVHGGKDGFRFYKDAAVTGGGVCNTCGRFQDGYAVLMWVNGWTFPETVQAVADYLRVGDTQMTPRDRQRAEQQAEARRKKELADQAEANRRARYVLNKVWEESLPMSDEAAAPARLYFKSRNLKVPYLSALRFHPSLYDKDADTQEVTHWPGILALATTVDGTPVTIHRTFLTEDGRKAPIAKPKKLLPYDKEKHQLMGTSMKLAPPKNGILAICEGLETGLSISQAYSDRLAVWVANGSNFLEGMQIPDHVHTVLVWADRDIPGEKAVDKTPPGFKSAKIKVDLLRNAGKRALGILPPDTLGPKVDWNDVFVKLGPSGFKPLDELLAQAKN